MKDFKKQIMELTPIQYKITQENGTERPFSSDYDTEFREGIYIDVVSKEVLFSSVDKFDAHCGWPSFTKPLDDDNIIKKADYSLTRERIEVRSSEGNSHLGHVFDDGPDDNLRYCINGASLEFIAKDELVQKGFKKYLSLFDK